MFVCLSVCLSVCLFVCLFVCLCFSWLLVVVCWAQSQGALPSRRYRGRARPQSSATWTLRKQTPQQRLEIGRNIKPTCFFCFAKNWSVNLAKRNMAIFVVFKFGGAHHFVIALFGPIFWKSLVGPPVGILKHPRRFNPERHDRVVCSLMSMDPSP